MPGKIIRIFSIGLPLLAKVGGDAFVFASGISFGIWARGYVDRRSPCLAHLNVLKTRLYFVFVFFPRRCGPHN